MKLFVFTLVFICATAIHAQKEFISVWVFDEPSDTLRFNAMSSGGSVDYSWSVSPSGRTGSGSFIQAVPGPVVLDGLSIVAGDTLWLRLSPSNLRRFFMGRKTDSNKLMNISQWGDVEWSSMLDAFSECSHLQVSAEDVPDLSKVESMSYMFAHCSDLNGPSNINSWNTSRVKSMYAQFFGAFSFNQELHLWNTSAVTSMALMFGYAESFNKVISSWNTTLVTDMNAMFVNASIFNQDIGNWDTKKVVNMSNMFSGALAFNQDISTWNTSSVEDMSGMFSIAYSFNQDIGRWNTSNVKHMDYMFIRALAFNQNISNWNIAKVEDLSWMFAYTENFNQNISKWTISSVKDISGVFRKAKAFNQNLGDWKFHERVDLKYMLDSCGIDCDNYSNILIGWQKNNPTLDNLLLYAGGLQYNVTAIEARKLLVNTQGWKIYDKGLSECITSVDDLSEVRALILYPNPIENQLFVEVHEEVIEATIFLTNSLGHALLSKTIESQKIELNLEYLPTGIYFLQVHSKNGIYTQKVIKE